MCRYRTYNRSTDSGVYFTLGIHRTAQFIGPPASAHQHDGNVTASSPVSHRRPPPGAPEVTSSPAVTSSQAVTSSVTSSGAGANSSEPRYVTAVSRSVPVTDGDGTAAASRFLRADFLTNERRTRHSNNLITIFVFTSSLTCSVVMS